jgi:membrane associated rhomboid family serine protease
MNPNINSFNNFNSGGGNNQGEPSFSDRCKAYWAEVPLFVRFVTTTTIGLYVLSWIFSVQKILSNIPIYVVSNFQIWRLVTSVLMTASIFNILFAFISWVPDAMKLEKTSGTVRYSLNFFVNSFLIQVLYTLAMTIISIFAGSGALQVPSSGLWPLIMAEITMLCLANPDNQVMLFFIPYQFKALYYPWALFAFFTLMNMTIQFDILAGIGYGYLFFLYLRSYIQFSDAFIQRCENNFIFKSLSKFTGFVPIQSSSLNSGFGNYNTQNNYQSNNTGANNTSNFRMDPADKTPVSTPFKGKGTVVGGGNLNFLNVYK